MLAPKESLVKILVKHNNTNNVIHCSNKGARTRSARAPLLFPSPLLLLLCLTKILTDKSNPNLDQPTDPNLDQDLYQQLEQHLDQTIDQKSDILSLGWLSKTAGLKPSSGRSWEESGPGPGRTGAELGPSYDRPTSRPKVRPKLTQGGPKPSPKSAQCQPSDVQLLLFFITH